MSGRIIHSSRAQAIAEGALIDVSALAREAGFRCPVAVSVGAWNECVAGQGATAPCALLNLLRHSLIPLDGGDKQVEFAVDVLNDDRPPPVVRLYAPCGPGDDGEPAITMMLEHEG